MVVVLAGEKRIIQRQSAIDIIIAEQAIDLKNSKPHEMEAAKELVAESKKGAEKRIAQKLSEADATDRPAKKKVA